MTRDAWPAELDDVTRALVACNSANPSTWPGGPGEQEVAELCVGWLAAHGVPAHLVTPPDLPGRPGVLAEAGTGHAPVLLLVGHLDTYRWQAPRHGDGRVRGAGAADMKGGLAGILVALARGVPTGTLRALLVPDEEHASRGIRQLLPSLRWDAALVAEDSGLRPGISHGGTVTAFLSPPDATHRLRRLRPDHVSRLSLARLPSGLVRLRLTVTPQQRATELAAALPGGDWFVRESFLATPDNALLGALGRALSTHDRDARPRAVSGWTEAAVLGATGRPCVVFGPGGGGAHTADEWADALDIRDAAAVLHDVAVEFCAGLG